ncbi:MAG: nucleoside deaminase [Armatimonadetes bacterium]|nr:nucleoside deaminase [Armatimonadota bacterium]
MQTIGYQQPLHTHPHRVPARQQEPVEVSPGVIDMRGGPTQYAFTAEDAAHIVVDNAAKAAEHGTFGVGGALIGPDHEVVAVVQNRVIQNGVVKDPTAHAERQLVDWYFEQVHRGANLPSPEKMALITSLDPCMMCCGASLQAGFHVVIAALDTFAGVNFKGDGKYETLPEGPRQMAKDKFGYVGIEGGRAFQGPQDAPYPNATIPAEVEKRSLDVFTGSLDEVKRQINAAGGGDVKPIDAHELLHGASPEVLGVLRAKDPQALSLRVDPNNPGLDLGQRLVDVATASAKAGNSFDAAALVDPNGNVMMVVGGQESHSPIRTPFMELTRAWASARAEAGPTGAAFLPHIKDCKVVTLMGPGRGATGVMQLGAYGSSVEGPAPASESAHWQYVIPSQTQAELDQEIANLPPLYSQVIKPEMKQVKNEALVRLGQDALRRHAEGV